MTEMTLPPASNDGLDPSDPPRMPFWHMTNTDEGRSMIVQQVLAGFRQQSVSGDTAAIWMREFSGTVKAVWFNILPLGWVGEWHPSPSLQWVVPLSGRWFVETQDGKRVEMGPGTLLHRCAGQCRHGTAQFIEQLSFFNLKISHIRPPVNKAPLSNIRRKGDIHCSENLAAGPYDPVSRLFRGPSLRIPSFK